MLRHSAKCCYVTAGGRSVYWPLTVAAAATPMLLCYRCNGCLTQLLCCYVTEGEGVFTKRYVMMEGVVVCDVTRATAEFT